MLEPADHLAAAPAVHVARATPAYLVFASHAVTLAAIQGMSRGDMAHRG